MVAGVRQPSRLPHVPALDGVRAIAIALVLGYHFEVPGFQGGFLGVDLFFVLSGFLITTLLLDEHRLTGAIDFVEFWLRRARRLLPAVLLLLFVLALWGTTLNPYEKGPLRWDLLGSLLYVANWRFILGGQSYFAEFATASPVRHLWSLGIEEQFYVAWPLVVAAAVVLIGSGRVRGRAAGVLGIGAAIASALMLGMTYDEADPSFAYYSTLTRAHELLIGALAAAALATRPPLATWARRHSERIIAGALGGIAVAAIVTSDAASIYYYGGSVLFSLASALLVVGIVAGHGSGGRFRKSLELRPVVWLGVVSYGVYLWHWPVAIWVTPESSGFSGPALLIARLGITLAIAAASFYLLERPVRRGRIASFRLGRIVTVAGTLIVGITVAATSVLATRGWRPPPDFLTSDPVLRVAEVPGADTTIGVVGDSVALSLYGGLRAEAAGFDASAVSAALPGCAIGDTLRTDPSGHLVWDARKCASSVVELQTEMVETYQPDLIIWYDQKDRQGIRDGGRSLRPGTPEWLAVVFADWDRALNRLSSGGAHVVLLLPLPAEHADPNECRSNGALVTPECVEPTLRNGALRLAYLEWAARHVGEVQVVDLADDLCPGLARCPAVIDGVQLRRDAIHFTDSGARLVIAWLFAKLPQGIRP